MSDDNKMDQLSRRGFLTAAAVAGAGAALSTTRLAFGGDEDKAEGAAGDEAAPETVPTREFGKTGVKVPILAVGGTINVRDNQLLLHQAFKWGATYWDTAEGYGGGRSEKGFGQFFEANSEARKKVFLVTKAGARDNAGRTKALAGSLDRLKTDYVDMFFIHGVSRPDDLNDDAKAWAEQMKKAGKIKFFGFSTHENMSECLARAATLGWVDGIMTTYNYRIVPLDKANGGKLAAAIEACNKAGIGLTAMKTQGQGAERYGNLDAEAEKKLLDAFTAKGFSIEQAASKAVWDNKSFACVCSKMDNMTKLKDNVAAAMDKTELSARQRHALERFAVATASSYCAGCSNICSRAVNGRAPVCQVMRYLMYHNAYGDKDEARELFAALPADVRGRLTQIDYSAAEARCPQGIAIGQRMKQAVETLA
ncbi:MAG: aldo/keto reductase [Planctomycetota bacterium]|jgi:predicted aldo/keto reductase-like oxidoreductase